MATIRDVAREAGVSIATVSRVFNQASLVTEATAQRVREVAARMDYWPNGAARSLITHSTHAIGVLLPGLHGEFFSEVIRGIDVGASSENFQVFVSSTHARADNIVAAVRALRGRIDGLIVMAPDAGSMASLRDFAERFPIVLLHPGSPDPESSAFSVSNFEGAVSAVEHLVALGHRRIAHLAGPAGNIDAIERARGWRHALEKAGLEVDSRLEVAGDFTEASGYTSAGALLAARPTAVFAANDYMAIGLFAALRDAGIAVPSEVAIVGFDDIAIAQYLTPPLTTVRIDARALGERALRHLVPFAREHRPAGTWHERMPVSLVVRSSCGTPVRGAVAVGSGTPA